MSDQTLHGLAAAPGLALGPALVSTATVVSPPNLGDPAAERLRLATGLARADATLALHEATLRAANQRAEAEIFAAHRMLLSDPSLTEAAEALIVAGHSTA